MYFVISLIYTKLKYIYNRPKHNQVDLNHSYLTGTAVSFSASFSFDNQKLCSGISMVVTSQVMPPSLVVMSPVTPSPLPRVWS